MLALMALQLRPGDEVVTQANTFNATVAAICLAGAAPVLVDAKEDSFLIDADQIPGVIGSRTRVLLPVHLYGKATPMSSILDLAKQHGLAVVEDAAQSHGASRDGRRTGSWGTLACFSFHPSKNLAAAGDAGAVVTDDEALAAELDRRRSLGQAAQNEHLSIAPNSKLDAIQARILSYKLPQLDAWNAARGAVAVSYRERLGSLPIQFQRMDPGEVHVFHLFQVRTKARDALLQHLLSRGIDAIVRYPTPIHLQPAFREFGWQQGQFPVAETLAQELLCLPIRPDMNADEIDLVCDGVRTFFGGGGA
jgi:dTDP-4-amino-4,6-dideoxygalactose transaminase